VIAEVFGSYEVFIFWLVSTIAVGFLAHHRGCNALKWVIISLFFSPLLAGIVLLLPDPKREKV
jgi:hypothetical protein